MNKEVQLKMIPNLWKKEINLETMDNLKKLWNTIKEHWLSPQKIRERDPYQLQKFSTELAGSINIIINTSNLFNVTSMN